jgi:hypothetical protein
MRSADIALQQTVEKVPSASLRSIALLQRTGRVRLRFACPERVEGSISRAPCIWDLFDRSENGVFQHPGNT